MHTTTLPSAQGSWHLLPSGVPTNDPYQVESLGTYLPSTPALSGPKQPIGRAPKHGPVSSIELTVSNVTPPVSCTPEGFAVLLIRLLSQNSRRPLKLDIGNTR